LGKDAKMKKLTLLLLTALAVLSFSACNTVEGIG